MKKNVILIVLLLVVMSCTDSVKSETAKNITSKEVEQFDNDRLFIIRYSNIIYEKNGKTIKIPIYQGTYGDVLYKDFRDYCLKMNYLEPKVRETGFIIKAKKGELRKTLHGFLDFYKGNILKSLIDKPTSMSCDGYEWFIFYDFVMAGLPCYMMIRFDTSEIDNENYRKYKTPYDIITNEDMENPNFSYSFSIGFKSTD
ncbi:MAG: hypothetical protein FWH53_01070 [Leptospirales bacterium]|nr:hypothetical protein [Leptospirales bacterium]